MESNRFIAGFIDFIICAVIQAILVMVFLIYPLIDTVNINIPAIFLKAFGITYISLSYLIFRDILGSKSIGKKLLHLDIVDIDTNAKVNISRRVLRNITWILAPIEIIVYLINDGKRIGDIIAKTKVIKYG